MAVCSRFLASCGVAAVAAVLWCGPVCSGAEADGAPSKAAAAVPAKPAQRSPTAEAIARQEQELADRYKHLEDVLLRMAELSATSDPRRAALLKKAVAQSKDELIGLRFDRLVAMLGKDQLSRALENETQLDQDLHTLLELLLSENRARSIEGEKARLRDYIKQLDSIIKQEKDLEGRTAGGDDTQRLAGEQAKVAEKTGGLANQMQGKGGKNAEAGGEKKAEKSGKKAESGEKKSDSAEKKADSGEKKSEKAEGDSKGKSSAKSGKGQSKGKPGGKSSSPPSQSQGEGQEGGQGEAKQSDSQQQQQQQQNPTRKRLKAAQEAMEQAEKNLKKAQREGAAKDQDKAIQELEKAKAELEEILRQLREEEIGRILAMLEARFRKMLQMEQAVYDGTLLLDKVPAAQRMHSHEIEAGRLSGKQSQIVVEVDKAALVLHEEGSGVAFPEAVDEIRDDMQQVVERLAQAKVGKVTQGVEEDIIAALKEMIGALKKAQKAQEEKKQKPKKGGKPSEQQDPPLVDALAELKMIRMLQIRINTRTAKYSKMIEGEQADGAELVEALQRLAERQQRLYRVTHDIQTKRNK